jgi:cell pole-organizing protein PopZ
MNDPKTQQEPSMEEILASIRRIITEDEPAKEDQAEAPPVEQDSDVELESEDVLELTEIAEDSAEEVASIPEPVEEPEDEPEDELAAEEIDFDAPVEPMAEEEIDFDAPLAEPEDDLELREEAEIPEELPVMAAPPVSVAPTIDYALIGEKPAGSTTGSLASLVAAVDRAEGGAQLGDANRTIEDLVKEVMRPMIREWLDENLPGLVDRVVRREIERLSRSAEGDN